MKNGMKSLIFPKGFDLIHEDAVFIMIISLLVIKIKVKDNESYK
jgi:hypothetical protein